MTSKDFSEAFCCQFYKVGEKIEAIRATIGAWFSADIIDVITKKECCIDNCQCTFKVLFDGDNDENEVANKDINGIRQVSYTSLKWEYLKPGMKVVINYNTECPQQWGYWYDCIIEKVIKREKVIYVKGTLLVGYDGGSCKIPIEFDSDNVADVLEIRSHSLLIEKELEDYETGVKPEYCLKCKNKPRIKCRKCCCCKCGAKKDLNLTVLCDECGNWYHIYCLDPPLANVPDEDDDEDWYCPNCNNESHRQKLESQLKLKSKGKRRRVNQKLKTPTKPREIRNRSKQTTVKSPVREAVEEAERLVKDLSKNVRIKEAVEKLYPECKIFRIWAEVGGKNNIRKEKKANEEDTRHNDVEKFISADTVNEHLWQEAKESLAKGQNVFLEEVERLFTCSICCELMREPITLSCKHSFCIQCFFKSLGVNVYHCALCRTDVIHTQHYVVNENLNSALKILFPSKSKRIVKSDS